MDKELVALLVEIYHSNFSKESILKAMQLKKEHDFGGLALNLGERILEANENTLTKADYKKTNKNFIKRIKDLQKNDAYQLIYFTAQILQYFTVITSKGFSSGFHFRQFQRFLNNHRYEFGEESHNLFLIEYQLIKMCNDLVQYKLSYIAFKPGLMKEPQSSYLKLIEKSLYSIKTDVESLQKEQVNSIFVHYLLFLMNYTLAELCWSKLKEESRVVSCLRLADEQKKYVCAAKKEIDEIKNASVEKEKCFGLEFGLGAKALFHFPEKNLEKLSKEMALLAA